MTDWGVAKLEIIGIIVCGATRSLDHNGSNTVLPSIESVNDVKHIKIMKMYYIQQKKTVKIILHINVQK